MNLVTDILTDPTFWAVFTFMATLWVVAVYFTYTIVSRPLPSLPDMSYTAQPLDIKLSSTVRYAEIDDDVITAFKENIIKRNDFAAFLNCLKFIYNYKSARPIGITYYVEGNCDECDERTIWFGYQSKKAGKQTPKLTGNTFRNCKVGYTSDNSQVFLTVQPKESNNG